jgi:hypothetical protein
MFKRTKELQSLVDASRKNLKDAERKVENRNILIADLQKKNKELRFENEEQKELIDRIARVATSNSYNNEKAILGKIKELISDYQSQN